MTELKYDDLEIGMIVRGISNDKIYTVERIWMFPDNFRVEYKNEQDNFLVKDTHSFSESANLELPHHNPKFKEGEAVKYNEIAYTVLEITGETHYKLKSVDTENIDFVHFSFEHEIKKFYYGSPISRSSYFNSVILYIYKQK